MNDRTTRSVLVTGGAGFLGSRVVKSYLDSGMAVRAVGHMKRQSCLDSPPALEVLELDVCDLADTLDAFAGQDLVIHTAAVIRAHTPDERARQRRVNVDGTRNVIAACRRKAVPRLVHVSTTAAIGISEMPGAPADESTRFNLDRAELSYNLTKHRAERLVLEANGPDLETVVVNPGFMFGRDERGYRGGEVIERVLGRRLVVCTKGGLSVVHVDDVVDGIRRAADNGRPGQRYILSGENLSFREIATTVSRVAGPRRVVVSVPNVVRDVTGILRAALSRRARDASPHLHLQRDYAYQFYSSDKARAELGYGPRAFANIVADQLDHASSSSL